MTERLRGVADNLLQAYVHSVIDEVLPNLEVKHLTDGRVAYWDPAKRALVIVDGDSGTVFTPSEGYNYFKRLKTREGD